MENKEPLYSLVPNWITRIVETKKCSKCQTKVRKSSICAVGVRTIDLDKSTVYVEHACSKCGERTITSFSREKSASVEELCYMLIEQIHNARRLKKSVGLQNRVRVDPIQDQEVASLLDMMDRAESYEDFLKYIGAPELPKEEDDES